MRPDYGGVITKVERKRVKINKIYRASLYYWNFEAQSKVPMQNIYSPWYI